jgi:hypothetical protein
MTEVLEAAQIGSVPSSINLPCAPYGDAAAVQVFDVRLPSGQSREYAFRFPSRPDAKWTKNQVQTLADTRAIWKEALAPINIVVPDTKIVEAYQASLGNLLLSLGPNGPRPGPLEHAKVWVRDAAFVGEALLANGRADLVMSYLPKLFEHQTSNGQIPAIIAPSGPETVNEWDSQGQAIFLVAAIYRHERDISFLQQWEPKTKLAAEFLRSLRARTESDPPSTRGLLPPSRSAEDLGPETWHHYWDNFWAVAGLDEAAYIERELGKFDDANWMAAEASAMRESIRNSVASVMGTDPPYVPGAPEGIDNSAMARGTSVSLFPVEVFSRDDPLIKRSFEVYLNTWIRPNNLDA